MTESRNILKQYIEENFSEPTTQEYDWRYQMRDMIDEWLYGIVPAFIFANLAYWGKDVFDFIGIPGLVGCGLYFLYLLYIIILRRLFTSYKLNSNHFVYTHGLFVQQKETLQLSDIVQITLKRSWWEYLIHTGTVEILFKASVDIHPNPLRIRGIGKYKEMFEKIDYYRNRHRLVLYFGI